MYPSWSDVCIPEQLVNSIKTMPACYYLDSLIYQVVFRKKRRALFTYKCSFCGHSFAPDRASEEVTCCEDCQQCRLTCTPILRFNSQVPGYSKRSILLSQILTKLVENHIFYFSNVPQDLIKVGWHDFGVYAQVKGGELITEASPMLCLVKACILCPFLWDNRFDWTNSNKTDTINVEHLSPILHNYCHGPWIGRPK